MNKKVLFYIAIIAFTLFSPFLFPAFKTQLATLWLMIVVALTWDMMGGQMGYNSLGNIAFFGFGMYICAVVQVGLYYLGLLDRCLTVLCPQSDHLDVLLPYVY